jgi:hypothetical protein
MKYRFTKPQVARGTRADGETPDKLLLIKKVSELRATYQIRLLTYRAVHEGKTLVIDISESCKVHRDLMTLVKAQPRSLKIVRN